MVEFLNSKLFQDLQAGVLPEVKVGIDDYSLFKLYLTLSGVILTFFILQKAFK